MRKIIGVRCLDFRLVQEEEANEQISHAVDDQGMHILAFK